LTVWRGSVTLSAVIDRRFRIVVCRGPECGDRRDSQAITDALATAVSTAGLGARVDFDSQSCFGRCSQGPNVLVRELSTQELPRRGLADLPTRLVGGQRVATAMYNRVTPMDATEIVASHVGRAAIVRRLLEPIGNATLLRSLPVAVMSAPTAVPASDGDVVGGDVPIRRSVPDSSVPGSTGIAESAVSIAPLEPAAPRGRP
jgi:(2Fe-2S) ferredoxin